MKIFLNGKFVSKKNAKISICDHGFLYGDAVYETMRTINGKPWLLKEHLVRLRNSAKEVGIKIPWNNSQISKWIQSLHKRNGLKESRIRITVSRGCNDFDFTTCKNPTIVIEANKLKLAARKIYKEGVSAITYEIERPHPGVKSTSMLPSVLARREAKKKKAFEAFLVDSHGNITEGSISNIFAVKKGTIITPKEGILEGTVRNYIIKKMKVKLANIPLNQIYTYDEVFLTSSVKGIVPVVKINGKKIGNGKVGPITKGINLWN